MRLTAIDIGTNTILMLIADVSADGSLSPLRDDQVIARLGKGVDADRKITPETTGRVLRYLRDYKKVSESLRSDKIVAAGTSALRDAANRKDFLDTVRSELGLEILILRGDEEAELTYQGAVSEFLGQDSDQSLAVLDIGGGSTELTFGKGTEIQQKLSLDLGSVRLTERTPLSNPPSSQALHQAVSEIRARISAFPQLPPHTKLIGVAGTPTTLAAIDLRLAEYDRARVSGHFLSLAAIERISKELNSRTISQMERDFPQIQPGRSDIIVAGVLILIESLRRFEAEGITVSDRGLRHGLALREILGQQASH
jgi:exopolyphosphatase / guanosine-5'-triphosphate,3'-diphosphate pyrophosphatase